MVQLCEHVMRTHSHTLMVWTRCGSYLCRVQMNLITWVTLQSWQSDVLLQCLVQTLNNGSMK
jgi:hypothetical protein